MVRGVLRNWPRSAIHDSSAPSVCEVLYLLFERYLPSTAAAASPMASWTLEVFNEPGATAQEVAAARKERLVTVLYDPATITSSDAMASALEDMFKVARGRITDAGMEGGGGGGEDGDDGGDDKGPDAWR